jgi:inactive STAND
MPTVLQSKIEELQQQLRILNEKLGFLRKKLAAEAGAAIQFQLEKEIEEAEAERERLEKQIARLGVEQFHNALFEMDHTEQVKLFRRFAETQRAAAFLIYGPQECGHVWLLKRLLRTVANSTTTEPFKFSPAQRRGMRNDIDALWGAFGAYVGLGSKAKRDDIAQRFLERAKTQHVILVVEGIDFKGEEYLSELLKDFWQPLVTAVRNSPTPPINSAVIMFMIDYAGCVGGWNLEFAEQLNEQWEPCLPIRLPQVREFPQDVLSKWIDSKSDILPLDLIEHAENRVQEILDDSGGGLPLRVLEKLYRLCGQDEIWDEEGDKRWAEI